MRELHVVAQVVEAELVVRDVGDVGAVGGAARGVVEVVQDHAHVEAEEAVHLAHPLGVAAREVVVDGDDVHAARERVQVRGQRRDERLALARAHLGDPAAVQHDAADQLHVVVALAERALGGLAHGGERLGQQLVERRAVSTRSRSTPVRARRSASESFGERGLERADLLDERDDPPDHPVVVAAEEGPQRIGHGVARRECTEAAGERPRATTAAAGDRG